MLEDRVRLPISGVCDLAIDFYPYRPFSERVWELRQNITVYDATYVALAEILGVPLITLDERLSKAPGPQCPIFVYPMTPDV